MLVEPAIVIVLGSQGVALLIRSRGGGIGALLQYNTNIGAKYNRVVDKKIPP